MDAVWTLVEEVMEPSEAFSAIAAGTPWMFHQCGGGLIRPEDPRAADLFRYAQKKCVSGSERDRLFRKGQRKKSMPTVVMAELWQDDKQKRVIAFREDGPYLLAARERPDKL